MNTADTDGSGEPGGTEEFRQLAAEHERLDHQLHELAERHYLSPDEQLEEITLKKRKLALKDQMATLRAHAGAHS